MPKYSKIFGYQTTICQTAGGSTSPICKGIQSINSHVMKSGGKRDLAGSYAIETKNKH